MINNNITSQGRLIVDSLYTDLYQWFVVHLFILKQILICSKRQRVQQCIVDNRRVIIYKKNLATLDPAYLDYLTNFAYKFDLGLIEDRRVQCIYAPYNRRKSSLFLTLISMLIIDSTVIASNRINIDNRHFADQQEVTQLLNWIRIKMSQLEFEVGHQLPDIKRLPRSEMFKLAFGSNVNRVSSKQLTTSVYGLYNYENKTIYLLDSVNIKTTKGKAILLHELVHFLQYQNGHEEKVECKNRLEYLAYYLEAAYLKEHGEEVKFSQDHMRRVVQCRS